MAKTKADAGHAGASGQAGYGDDDMTRTSGWDALMSDLFGLNARAFRTVWDTFTKPSEVFAAAFDKDWLDRYTPSIRLALSLIAATVFLKFIWLNDASGLFAFAQQMVSANEMSFAGRDLDTATRDYLSILLVTYPFTFLAAHLIGAMTLHIWGKGTPMPVRIRLYFVALSPVLLVGLASSMLSAGLTVEMITMVTAVAVLIVFLVYFLILRAGLKGLGRTGKVSLRALLGAGVMMAADLLVGMVSSVWATIWLFSTPA